MSPKSVVENETISNAQINRIFKSVSLLCYGKFLQKPPLRSDSCLFDVKNSKKTFYLILFSIF